MKYTARDSTNEAAAISRAAASGSQQMRDRWLVRATFALALATPAVLWDLNFSLSSDHSYVFEIQFASSAPGTLQVFYDRGRGLNEAESIAQNVSVGNVPETLQLPLPGGTYRLLRIDPPAAQGRFIIAGARIKDWRGRVVREIPVEDLYTAWQITRVAIGPPAVFESPARSNDPELLWEPRSPLSLSLSPRSRWSVLLICLS